MCDRINECENISSTDELSAFYLATADPPALAVDASRDQAPEVGSHRDGDEPSSAGATASVAAEKDHVISKGKKTVVTKEKKEKKLKTVMNLRIIHASTTALFTPASLVHVFSLLQLSGRSLDLKKRNMPELVQKWQKASKE